MKNETTYGLSRAREFAVIAALLSLYGLAIVLSPDSEWVVWAGQMSVGVIDPSALPPAAPFDAVDALHTASTLGVLGLLAAAALVGALAGRRPGRLSRLFGQSAGGPAHGRRAGERHA